jgi:hypothetical protein
MICLRRQLDACIRSPKSKYFYMYEIFLRALLSGFLHFVPGIPKYSYELPTVVLRNINKSYKLLTSLSGFLNLLPFYERPEIFKNQPDENSSRFIFTLRLLFTNSTMWIASSAFIISFNVSVKKEYVIVPYSFLSCITKLPKLV